MVNYYILEKEMQKINKEVDRMKDTMTTEPEEKFLPVTFKGLKISCESEKEPDINLVKTHLDLLKKNYNDYVDGVSDKISKKMDGEIVDLSGVKLESISHFQKEKTDTFSMVFSYKDVKCNLVVSFDEKGDDNTTISLMKESAGVAKEYGSADLGDMLPQTTPQKPVLNKDTMIEEPKEDIVPKEEKKPDVTTVEEDGENSYIRDITDDERDADEVKAKTAIARNAMMDELRTDVKSQADEVYSDDPFYGYLLQPTFETPFDLTAKIKEKVNENKILHIYWDTKLLEKAVELHSKYKDVLSPGTLETLQKKLKLRKEKLDEIQKKIGGPNRGKYDYAFKKIDEVMNRKFVDADRFMRTKVDSLNEKFDKVKNPNKVTRIVDRMFASFIRKTTKEKKNIKEYLKNLENMVESVIEMYPDSMLNCIFEKCLLNLRTNEQMFMNTPVMEKYLETDCDINVKESVFDQYATMRNAFMVTMESMKEMIENLNKTDNSDVIEVLEKSYFALCKTTAEMDLFVESIEEIYDEATDMEDEIRPIVELLNRKGYKVKYANPGHLNFRSKRDGKRDGLMYGKLYSDAHIQFDGEYGIKAPEHWHFRSTENGDYLDVDEPVYTHTVGSDRAKIREERSAFKINYMASLKKWAEDLPDISKKEEKPVKESVDFDDLFNDFI